MAGGKQSPRDKMIGMMYLVLTALLALQVSNSVLEKFVFLNIAFESTNTENEKSNVVKIEGITAAVTDAGNRSADVAVLTKAQEVRAETTKILAVLKEYKVKLIDMTGNLDENGAYVGQKDIDASSNLFVEQKEGEVLKTKLNDYSSFLRKTTGDESIPNLAKDASEIKLFADDPNQRMKGFSELNFGDNTPMVGALASLSQLQSDVITEESKALEDLAKKVGAEDLKFDKIVAMVRPESNVVAAGTKYRADMFIAASSSSVNPSMTVDGRGIEVVGGFGKVEFTATPGNYDNNGNVVKSYEAKISLKGPGGKDTTFTETIKYTVSKPVIQIQSASVTALFLNCGNELDVQVPALGNDYNPSFSAKGAQCIAGKNKGLVMVVPSAAAVELSISSNGNLIGMQPFKVKRIPKPEIVVYSGGKEVDMKRGLTAAPKSLKLAAEPDESFKQFLPNDAIFRVSESEITLVRSGRAVSSLKSNGPDINLTQIAGEARSGDAIVVEIKKVQRKNFKGEVEDFANFGPKILNIRIN